jgi:2-dehydropantoate 2-reductase
MKIAMVGCGAVGSYYGAKLARSGLEVHFLLRSDYQTVLRDGIKVQSFEGDFQVRPKCARLPEEIGPCDLILIALKTTADQEYVRLLAPLVRNDSVLATLQNGLGNEEKLHELFPGRPVIGGLCFVCLNRIAPGVVVHLDHGKVVVGDFSPARADFGADKLASLFTSAGVSASMTENLALTRWEKLAWNIPFNGLGVASAGGLESVLSGSVAPGFQLGRCLTTDQLLAAHGWYSLVRELMAEVIGAARSLGLNIPDGLADKMMDHTRTMGAYKASTVVDFERRNPLELESIFLEPLRRAKLAGQEMPRLSALCKVLQELDKRQEAAIPSNPVSKLPKLR